MPLGKREGLARHDRQKRHRQEETQERQKMKPIKPPEKRSVAWAESFAIGILLAITLLFTMGTISAIIGFFK